jgi:hypothetical protein
VRSLFFIVRDVVKAPNGCKEKNFTGMFPSLMSFF